MHDVTFSHKHLVRVLNSQVYGYWIIELSVGFI